MKYRIAIAILLMITTLFAGGCTKVKQAPKKENQETVPEKPLLSYTKSSAGGMSGGREITEVQLSDDGLSATLFIGSSNWYNLDLRSELYVVDKALLDEIAQIIREYKMYDAIISEQNEYFVYDAPTIRHTYRYEDGTALYFSSIQELSDGFFEGQKKINQLIEDYRAKGESYPTVYAQDEEDYVDWKAENQITLHVKTDAAFSITLEIYNGQEEPVTLTGDVVLSRLRDGEAVDEKHILIDLSVEDIRSGASAEKLISFTMEDYPQEGTYQISFAGYKATFELLRYE